MLDRHHVKALLALDDDLALDCAWVEAVDSDRSRMHARDAERMADAQRYLELIGDNETERRASTINNQEPSADGRSRHHGYQLCPVCGHQTLLVAGTDPFGMNVGHGTCLICSYHRTEEVAEADAEWMGIYSDDAPNTTLEA
ncbi:hypothetical protein [Streptomyces sp. NPDC050804]|uniref:hypothetical protein n=1 Tax=Streptomyces sp. NPDC050804 TaxID=3154745 RepID=UPI0034475BD2